MGFVIGIDTGGTFTDCVVIDADGRIVTAKASSTPGDFAEGVMESLRLAGDSIGLTTEALLRDTDRLALGTTVGTNAMLQRRGARVGLITTRGHRDVIHIMRGARGVPGLNNVQVLHFPESGKPDPIVPKPFIAEVSERVDCKGEVVVELNEAEAEAAIRTLVGKGVEAIAICFLWSFKHAEHERRVKAMAERLAPGVFVCCSADLIPRWGEYERTVATVLNAYLGPVMSRYLGRLETRAQESGLRYPLQVMQCGGGVIPAGEAARRAFLTLDSGPVAGVLASQYLGGIVGDKHVIATDMGGTSFDVGLVWDGEPWRATRASCTSTSTSCPGSTSARSAAAGVDHLDRRGERDHAGRSDLGRRPARPGLLRTRRHPANRHRRRPRAGLHRSALVPRRPAAPRCRARAPEPGADRHASRPGPRRDRRRRGARGRAPDGRSHPQGHRAEGLRSTGLRGVRVRRRRPRARRGLRAGARRAARRGAARRRLLAVVGARRRVGRSAAHLRGRRHPAEPLRSRADDGALRRARGARARAAPGGRHRSGARTARALGRHPLQGPDQRGRGAGPRGRCSMPRRSSISPASSTVATRPCTARARASARRAWRP